MKVLGASRLQVAITLAAAVALLLLVYVGAAQAADPSMPGKNIGKWGTDNVAPLWKFGAAGMAAILMFGRRAARLMEHGMTVLYTGLFVTATPVAVAMIKGIAAKWGGN
jgi:hypothetical protein